MKAKRMMKAAKMPAGYSYGKQSRKGVLTARPRLPTEADLLSLMATAADIVRAADRFAEQGLPQPVLDGLPAELCTDLQRWCVEMRRWTAAGGNVRTQLAPLLQRLRNHVRASQLAEAKFQIGDPVETPHGRGIVRDLVTEEHVEGDDWQYSVDGGIYQEGELRPVAAVDRLGDLHEAAEPSEV